MNTIWKAVIVGAALIAALAFGMATAALFDVQVAQSDPEAPVTIDLTRLMLRYDDPMRGMSGEITIRQVFQDALWWQIMDPQASEETRAEAFFIVGVMQEGRGTELTQAQYDLLMDAVQRVWGPAILAAIEAELQ
jgi:hypothetical protein